MARKNPTAIGEVRRDKHEQMTSDMHDALYTLGDKIRKPYPRAGEHMLPSNLQEGEKPEAKAARKHIERLHKAFKSAKKA